MVRIMNIIGIVFCTLRHLSIIVYEGNFMRPATVLITSLNICDASIIPAMKARHKICGDPKYFRIFVKILRRNQHWIRTQNYLYVLIKEKPNQFFQILPKTPQTLMRNEIQSLLAIQVFIFKFTDLFFQISNLIPF